jgi:signal transduction histidine kinase
VVARIVDGQVFVVQLAGDIQQILLDQIREAAIILDAGQATWPLLAHNRAYRDLFPAGANPLIGAPWDSGLSPSASALVAPHLRASIVDGTARTVRAVPFAVPVAQQDTVPAISWDWQCQPTRGDGGAVERIIVTMLRTSSPSAEQHDLLTHDHTVATLIDGLTEGIFILDHQGIIQGVNPAGRQLLNVTGEARWCQFGEILRASGARRGTGQPFDPVGDFVAPLLSGQPVAIDSLVIADGAASEVERHLGGVPLVVAPDRIGGAIIFVRDSDARRQTDKDRDSFLSLISHEIKSPLTSIKGFAQLAIRAIESDDQPLRRAAKHLRVIEQQADRIGHLIGDLSDVSRMQRGTLQLEPTVFDLVPTIKVAVEQQQPNFGTHRITLALPDEPLIVRADPQRIQQLLGNLLSNAAKASPLADRIEVTVERYGDGARLSVHDFGVGIAPEEQTRIFERFYRTTGGSGSGLGLGLFIAQQIALHSAGTLTVESEPGSGSTFRLDLPLAQPDGSDDDDY